MQIQTALAPENQPDYTQLHNETYLMQSFEKLVSDLEAPFGVRPFIHGSEPSQMAVFQPILSQLPTDLLQMQPTWRHVLQQPPVGNCSTSELRVDSFLVRFRGAGKLAEY